jgi:hypothetical protein
MANTAVLMSKGKTDLSRKLEEEPYLRFAAAEDASPGLAAAEDPSRRRQIVTSYHFEFVAFVRS